MSLDFESYQTFGGADALSPIGSQQLSDLGSKYNRLNLQCIDSGMRVPLTTTAA
jgi:hypothetical protein